MKPARDLIIMIIITPIPLTIMAIIPVTATAFTQVTDVHPVTGATEDVPGCHFL